MRKRFGFSALRSSWTSWSRALAAAAVVLSIAPPVDARVVIVGIDGGSWDVLQPMIDAGECPNLAALMERGSEAVLRSVEPVISPVNWASLATGRSPVHHGVTSFAPNRLGLRVPTLYERLAARGLRVGLYDYLVNWPPLPYPGGFSVPGWSREDDAVTPPDLWQKLGLPPYYNSYDGLFTREEYLESSRQELVKKPAYFTRMLETFDPAVSAVVFYAFDSTSHRYWDDLAASGPVGDEPRAKEAREAIREMVLGFDRAVGEIAAALGPDDSMLVVSDHGFQGVEDGVLWENGADARIWSIRLREALARKGLEPPHGFTLIWERGLIVARVHPGQFAERERTLETITDFLRSAQNLHGEPLLTVDVLDRTERPESRPWLQRLRQTALDLYLKYVRQINLDEPAHAYIFATMNAAVLDRIAPGEMIQVAGQRIPCTDLLYIDNFTGTHAPEAILVAAGPAVRADQARSQKSVLDVAPLVFYLADQPIPDDLEGKLPTDWILPEHLAAHPPRAEVIEAATTPLIPADEALRERLQAHGYSGE